MQFKIPVTAVACVRTIVVVEADSFEEASERVVAIASRDLAGTGGSRWELNGLISGGVVSCAIEAMDGEAEFRRLDNDEWLDISELEESQ